jgi:hypothetical protein
MRDGAARDGDRPQLRLVAVAVVTVLLLGVGVGCTAATPPAAAAPPAEGRPAAAIGSCEQYVTAAEVQKDLQAAVLGTTPQPGAAACDFALAGAVGTHLSAQVVVGDDPDAVERLRKVDLGAPVDPAGGVEVDLHHYTGGGGASLDVTADAAVGVHLVLATDSSTVPPTGADIDTALRAVAARILDRFPPYADGTPLEDPAVAGYVPPGPPEPCPALIPVSEVAAALGKPVRHVDAGSDECVFLTGGEGDPVLSVSTPDGLRPEDRAQIRQEYLDPARIGALPPEVVYPRLETRDGDVRLLVGPSFQVELANTGIRGAAGSPVTAAALARIARTVLDHL